MRVPALFASGVAALVIVGGSWSPAGAAGCAVAALCADGAAPPAPSPAPPAAEVPVPSAGPGPARPPAVDEPASARELFALVNRARTEAGANELVLHSDAEAVAFEHSRAMAARHDIFHNEELFTAESKRRLGAVTLGENVALNGTPAAAHDRLMASPEHRANIESTRFTSLAVGAVRGDDGRLYITEVFIEQRRAAPAPAPTTTAPGPATASVPSASAPAPRVSTTRSARRTTASPAAAQAAPATDTTTPEGAPDPDAGLTTTTTAGDASDPIELASAGRIVAVPARAPGSNLPFFIAALAAALALSAVAVRTRNRILEAPAIGIRLPQTPKS